MYRKLDSVTLGSDRVYANVVLELHCPYMSEDSFFEGRVTEYQKSTALGNIDDDEL